MPNSITFLGTGTSQGIPMIGCKCNVCKSDDKRDKRLRSSALVEWEGLKILIDAGPDFRYQMLRENITHLDAILLTHQHKDHTGGLDDVRALNYFEKRSFPIFCEKRVEESLKMEYSYAFAKEKYPGVPDYTIININEDPFSIDGKEVVPIRVMHYKLPILGFRFGNMAYITDANYINDTELEKFKNLDILVLNCVRLEKHISHYSLSEAIDVIRSLNPKKGYLTHLSHQMPTHRDSSLLLPENIELAYDGLKLYF